LNRKVKESNDFALQSQFYLKSSIVDAHRWKMTTEKYKKDLAEKRKEEMQVLERILNGANKNSNLYTQKGD
jgi:hypothetical protein